MTINNSHHLFNKITDSMPVFTKWGSKTWWLNKHIYILQTKVILFSSAKFSVFFQFFFDIQDYRKAALIELNKNYQIKTWAENSKTSGKSKIIYHKFVQFDSFARDRKKKNMKRKLSFPKKLSSNPQHAALK